MPKKQSLSRKPKRPYGQRSMPDGESIMKHVKELILPTAPNQYGSTALIDSDFNTSVLRALNPYNTIGNQKFFWRSTLESQTTQNAGSNSNGAFNFQLSAFNGYSDFTGTFDMYKLKAVSIRFDPMYPSNGIPFPNISPRLFTVIDYDDSNTALPGTLQQYDTCVTSPPGCGQVRVLIPRMSIAAYGSGAFTSYANQKNEWIDMASPSVQHYGVKWSIDAGAAGQTVLQTYTIHVEGFWEFMATR